MAWQMSWLGKQLLLFYDTNIDYWKSRAPLEYKLPILCELRGYSNSQQRPTACPSLWFMSVVIFSRWPRSCYNSPVVRILASILDVMSDPCFMYITLYFAMHLALCPLASGCPTSSHWWIISTTYQRENCAPPPWICGPRDGLLVHGCWPFTTVC